MDIGFPSRRLEVLDSNFGLVRGAARDVDLRIVLKKNFGCLFAYIQG